MKILDIPNPFGGPVYHHKAVDSTMDEAARLSERGVPHGTVVMADHQRKGQGRVAGRRWESMPGESLMFTLILASEITGSPVEIPYSLIAGMAVCRTLEPLTGGAKVKWPNDVLLSGEKCAGILTRSRASFVHIGIGINCNQESFTGTYNYRPTSILKISGRPLEPVSLLAPLLEEMKILLENGWDPQSFTQVLYGLGSRCRIGQGLPDSGIETEGIITGVSDKGELVVRNSETGNRTNIASGEIIDINLG